MDEFRRWRYLSVSPDRPLPIVKIELRQDVSEIDIGRPIGVDRSDIAPVGALIITRAHAGTAELVRHGTAVLDDVGDDVLAEIMVRIRIGGVAPQLVEQE